VRHHVHQVIPFGDINNILPYFVDGERGMQWVADRFNGLPTTPNCDLIPPPD
jgi:hypothetical protein